VLVVAGGRFCSWYVCVLGTVGAGVVDPAVPGRYE